MKTLLGAALVAAMAGVASAEISTEAATFGGYVNVDFATGETTYSDTHNSTRAFTMYSNTASPANFGVSSTDLTSTWGDECIGVAYGGPLTGMQYTVFNSGSSLGSLMTATVQVNYYRASDGSPIGAWLGNINFGTGLAKGFYSVVTFSGLDGLGINFNTNDLIVTQKVTAKTGLASRLGIVSMNPVNIGSSFDDMYIASSTIGTGWFTFSNGPAQTGYQIDIPAPGAASLLGLAGLIAGRRRR